MAGVKAIDPAVADPIVLSSRLVVELYPTKNITHHIRHVAQPRKRAVPVTDVWKRVKGLGEGTYGKVYMEKCVDGPRLQELQAVKRIRKRPNVDWEGELRTIALFSAEMFRNSFVESTGWYETSSHVYVVMELVEHGDLQKHLRGPLPEQEGQTIIFQILQGLSFLHQQGFAHRDLKPKNIMVATLGPDWWVKIADFGISKRVMAGGTELRTSVGTAAYMAPEVHGFLQGPAAYTKAVDIWAAGVIAFVVLAGKSPFDNAGALAAYVTQGIESSIERLKELPISNDGCELVQRCISIQPEARPGADEALRFGWFEHLQQSPRASSSITNVEAKVDLDAESVRASFELERADRETGTDFSATWNNARQESTPASSRQIDCEGSAAGIDMDVEPAGASFERDESNLGASTNVSPGIATHFAGSTTSIVPAPPAWRKRFPLDRSTTLTLSKPPTEPFLRIINISPQVQVGSLKFSQDQECLFTEFRNGDLRFWRVNDGKLASELNYFAASYRRWNGPQLFMVNTKKVIRFQTLLMNKARAARHDSRTFVGPPWKCVRTTDFGDITPLKLSHNGSFIVYGTADPQKTRLKIMVKDLELGTFLATLGSIPHHEHFRGAFSQNDEFLVARIDGQITVWNTRSWEVHAWSDFYSIYHTPLAVSSDGNLIPHVDNHNILYLWIVGKGVVASRFEHGENASVDEAEEARVVHEVQFSPDDRLLLVVRVNKTHEIWVGVWSVTSNELLRRIYLPNSSDLHHACAFSPDGSLFALATYGTIFICDVLHAIEKEPLRKNGTMNSEPFARNTPRDTKGALDMEEQALLLQKAQRSRHRVLQDANTARMTEVSKSAWKSLKNVFS